MRPFASLHTLLCCEKEMNGWAMLKEIAAIRCSIIRYTVLCCGLFLMVSTEEMEKETDAQ